MAHNTIFFEKNNVLWQTCHNTLFFKKYCVVAEKNKVAETCHHTTWPPLFTRCGEYDKERRKGQEGPQHDKPLGGSRGETHSENKSVSLNSFLNSFLVIWEKNQEMCQNFTAVRALRSRRSVRGKSCWRQLYSVECAQTLLAEMKLVALTVMCARDEKLQRC